MSCVSWIVFTIVGCGVILGKQAVLDIFTILGRLIWPKDGEE